ncbi:MAG: rhodanese-like domain-containing protein [Cytophagaceae bacterium]|nr:rhodanese-like domain-containing protein [Cytophagaceae bacterium]
MDISVEELKERLDKGENLPLLDVRNPDEYEVQNIGAKLIPLGDLADRLDEIEDWKDEEVIVHCRSGKRSATAQQIMEQAGFTNVRNLTGGMLAWNEMDD